MRFEGTVYRAHHPRWAFTPLSGDGAARYGGRFNPVGVAALYTSTRMETAWREAQQGFAFKAQPLTIVSYRVDCADVEDLTDPETCARLGVEPAMLSCAWEDIAARGQIPPSWALARRLIAQRVAGILVPSFAPGANPQDRNLVFYEWAAANHRIEVVDDEGRLSLR